MSGDDRAQRYPRAGGVVIPPELMRFCDGIGVSANEAAGAARAVVQRMARVTYALPRSLRELRLPSPAIVLQAYLLDERTRRVLERAAPETRAKRWTVAEYLALPRFGPFCLVDLLAARAESGPTAGRRGAPAPPPCALPLDEVSALLMRAMPLGGDQVGPLLDHEGTGATVRELARAYRSAGRTVPFRVIRHGGCEVVVAPSVRNAARTVLVAATQFISWWGLTTVQQIVTRAQLRATTSVSAAFVARMLASLPQVVWLDQGREWFSFRGNSSALLRAIRDALGAVERVELPSLGRALAGERALLAKLPAGVWERYLSLVAGCAIDGVWVRLPPAGLPSPA